MGDSAESSARPKGGLRNRLLRMRYSLKGRTAKLKRGQSTWIVAIASEEDLRRGEDQRVGTAIGERGKCAQQSEGETEGLFG